MKKLISLLLICAVMVGCGAQAFAANTESEAIQAEVDTADGILRAINTDEVVYLSGSDWVLAFEDSNFWSDDYVTATFKSTQNPATVAIQIDYLSGSTWTYGNSGTVSVGSSVSSSIPAGASFRVWAKKASGSNGNVTLNIVLN